MKKISAGEGTKFFLMVLVFIVFYFLPVEQLLFRNPFYESLALLKWYAREHVLLCLVPEFFIAGAISVFVSQTAVMKYLGAKGQQDSLLRRCIGFRNNPCRLFLHGAAVFINAVLDWDRQSPFYIQVLQSTFLPSL